MEKETVLPSDLVLVEEVKNGDRAAFAELVRRHQRSLLKLCLRFVKEISLAEDVLQETFIKAYEKLGSFEGRSSFKSWLFQIAVNNARNRLRENRHFSTSIENVHLAVPAVGESRMIHGSIADMLNLEVNKLPFKQKTALVLRIYEDLSFAEIAQIMDCPYDTAKANYRHGIMKLRETFEGQRDLKTWSAEGSDMNSFYYEFNQILEAEG